jgi:hypothetical protein
MDFVVALGMEDAVFEFDSDDESPATSAADVAIAHPYEADDAGEAPDAATADSAVAREDVRADVAEVTEAAPIAVETTSDAVASAMPAAGEPSRPDAFTAYVSAVVEVAQAAGNARAAAALPALLEGAEFDLGSLPGESQARLVAAQVLSSSGTALSPSDAFTSMASAWRSVLRGDTQDLSACGDSTLDGWSADVLKAFGVGQGGATDVRRELRRRGVAAFGMLLAA